MNFKDKAAHSQGITGSGRALISDNIVLVKQTPQPVKAVGH